MKRVPKASKVTRSFREDMEENVLPAVQVNMRFDVRRLVCIIM